MIYYLGASPKGGGHLQPNGVSPYTKRALVVFKVVILEKSRVMSQLRSSSSTACGKSSPPSIFQPNDCDWGDERCNRAPRAPGGKICQSECIDNYLADRKLVHTIRAWPPNTPLNAFSDPNCKWSRTASPKVTKRIWRSDIERGKQGGFEIRVRSRYYQI